MGFYAIVNPKVEPIDLSVHADALEEIKVEYSDILQLTLSNWHEFGTLLEDDESLRTSIETHLATHYVRRLKDYAHMQEMVGILVDSIAKFHEQLQEQLGPLLEAYGIEVQIRLSRFLHKDALIRVETKL